MLKYAHYRREVTHRLAEGATTPETLRQKDCNLNKNLERNHLHCVIHRRRKMCSHTSVATY